MKEMRTVLSPSNWAILLGALLLSACDAQVEVHFRVSTVGNDSVAEQSRQIASILAARHGVGARTRSDCKLANYEHHGDTRLLELCLERESQSVSVQLMELIYGGTFHPHWSAKGDSLRRELEDTLYAQFGERVTRIH